MRIFQNPKEMVKEVERDLFEMGHRYQSKTVQDQDVADDPRFQTIELAGYGYRLSNPDPEELLAMASYFDYNEDYRAWMVAESRERTEGLATFAQNPGLAWKHREDFWGQFIRNGVFSYSYCERWQAQIPYVVQELRAKPNTRQAILTMYDRHEDMLNWGGADRVPCSVSYQFMIRAGKLDVIYNQRSCDFMKFFLADIYFTTALMQHVALQIEVPAGDFVHFLGSLHAFAGDLEDRNIF
jgi:hypothetical protein